MGKYDCNVLYVFLHSLTYPARCGILNSSLWCWSRLLEFDISIFCLPMFWHLWVPEHMQTKFWLLETSSILLLVWHRQWLMYKQTLYVYIVACGRFCHQIVNCQLNPWRTTVDVEICPACKVREWRGVSWLMYEDVILITASFGWPGLCNIFILFILVCIFLIV